MTPSQDYRPLHPLEFRILMVLGDGPSYGTEIVRQIEAKESDGPRLYPANLFRRIRDLLGAGLWEECPAPLGADPRRSYVRITRRGRAVARAEARRLAALVQDARAHQLLPEG